MTGPQPEEATSRASPRLLSVGHLADLNDLSLEATIVFATHCN